MYVSFVISLALANSIFSDGTWNIRFAVECVAEVAARALTAETPSYTTIMELDRKVREFPLWEDAVKTAASEAPKSIEGMSPSEAITLCVMSHAREVGRYSSPFAPAISR